MYYMINCLRAYSHILGAVLLYIHQMNWVNSRNDTVNGVSEVGVTRDDLF